MKLYRVLPDTYSIKDNNIVTKNFPGNHTYLEGIYNKGGLTSLELDINKGMGSNSIGEKLKEPSKYFFIFPEDAINCAYILLPSCNFARIVEYEIPDEIVLQNIGLGQYREDIVIETAVGRSNFDGERFRYRNIPRDKHIDYILPYLKDTIDMHKFRFDNNFSITDEEILKMYNENYYLDVLRYDCNSILTISKYFTGNMYTFTNSSRDIGFNKMHDMNIEYLKEKGLTLDYSEEASKERHSLIENIKDLPDGFYINISAFRNNDIVRERVRNYIQTH